MKNIISRNIYFSSYFNVDEEIINEYGAYDINLVMDTPLFIDPFLLFNSDSKEYQKLHEEIIKYLVFLKDQARNVLVEKQLERHLQSYYVFPEAKECWLGYSKNGNEGAGLNLDFARTLYDGLNKIITNVGAETITKSTHLEKLCLIADKVDIDKISDFTANLIKHYLLEYTENFARKYIDKSKCKEITVDRAYFNYDTKTFAVKKYYLPIYEANGKHEFVILTPRDILRHDSTWINKHDFIDDYDLVIATIPNQGLKYQLESYINSVLIEDEKHRITQQERQKCLELMLREFPELIDYYIKYKEDNEDGATVLSNEQVQRSKSILQTNAEDVVRVLFNAGFFQNYSLDSFEEAVDAVKYLKTAIEENGLYRDFYDDEGKAIEREEILNNLYRLCFRKSHFLYNAQVNNGNGPCDSQVSFGSDDCTIVEFKLAKSTSLKRNLEHQTEAYLKTNHTDKKVKVIIYFNDAQLNRANRIIAELKMTDEINKSIFLIDANNQNKISASRRGKVA